MPSAEQELIESLRKSESSNVLKGSIARSSKYLIEDRVIEQLDELRDNQAVFSTPIDNIKNSTNPEWWVWYRLSFNTTHYRECNKFFTISLYEWDKNKEKSNQLGVSKTFNISHFRDQKIHEISIEFKQSYDSKIQGTVLIRAQYIHDQVALMKEILTQLYQKRSLINSWIEILNKQRTKLFGRGSSQIKEISPSNSNDDSKFIGGGFYSYNDDSMSHQNDETSNHQNIVSFNVTLKFSICVFFHKRILWLEIIWHSKLSWYVNVLWYFQNW